MIGLTSQRAFEVLSSEIEVQVGEFKHHLDMRTSFFKTLQECHNRLQFKWVGFIQMTIVSVVMACLGQYLFCTLAIAFMLASIIGGMYIAVQMKYQLYNHMHTVLETVDKIGTRKVTYESLWQPMSPCISLQWVHRDGRLVNAPTQIIVKGDIVRMRPGQEAPGKCVSMDKKTILSQGDRYNPPYKNIVGMIDSCHLLIEGATPRDFLMLETPYIKYLQLCLCKGEVGGDETNNIFTRQQKTIMGVYIKRYIIPLVGIMSIFIYGGHCCETSHFDLTYMALTLTPLIFLLCCPLYWFVQHALGTAKLIYYSDLLKGVSEYCDIELADRAIPWIAVARKSFREKTRFWHSGSFLEVLASVTNLCCVDKKGILSWPNAIPEKVFFLKQLNIDSSAETEEDLEKRRSLCINAKAEVLDLTLRGSSNSIMFDDPKWTSFISNLKPLGLSILINDCDEKTHEKYSNFFDHVSFESAEHEVWIPAINKRCLCDLSRQMGFTQEAVSCYEQLQHLHMFRHDEFDNNKNSAINIPRLKMPFPNFCSSVIRDEYTESLQMFSQGTADLILDHCTDYWDGHNICELTESDRKCILDFYQRTSLTAYCTAFAYTPLENCAGLVVPNNTFIQVPTQSSFSLFTSKCGLSGFTSCSHADLSDVVHNIEGCSKAFHSRICRQVFIGMVTLQYQARPNFVRLIEELDKACIRFVHFSKENELRSRGFSEKMGLESGWNCHISLLHEEEEDDYEETAPVHTKPMRIKMKYNNGAKCRSFPSVVSSSTFIKSKDSRSSYKLSMSPSPKEADTGSEVSTAVQFDIANRAKLPKGIGNMRAHIENVDNVPLLVSLFTDCTASATKEMVKIMQENKEVICILGSSRNIANLQLFIQADCSISWHPQSPRLCISSPLSTGESELLDLVSCLNSLPCILHAQTDDEFAIFQLVNEARHFVSQMQSSFQFVFLCSLTLSLLHLTCHLCRLPLPISPLSTLYLLIVVIPLIGFSLVCSPTDKGIMNAPNVDSLKVNKDTRLFCVISYLLKSTISVMILVLCKALTILKFCRGRSCDPRNILSELQQNDMESLQHFNMLLLCVHFVALSSSFLNRKKLLLQHNPLLNRTWVCACTIALIVQAVALLTCSSLGEVSLIAWAVMAVSPFVLIAATEGCKYHELKLIRRQEKRIRLHFMTKLGMNSPF